MIDLSKLSAADQARLRARTEELTRDPAQLEAARARVGPAAQRLNPEQIRAVRIRDSFLEFVREFWPIVEPAVGLLEGEHMRAICAHLQAIAEGRIQRLLINVPPGHAKSLLCAVMFPAWMWLRKPGWRVLCGSYAQDLSNRDSQRSRELLKCAEYEAVKRALGLDWTITKDQDRIEYFSNSAKGFRVSLSVGGKATGFRGDCLIFDDLVNAKEPEKITRESLEAARSWWRVTMSSRLNNLKTGQKIGIMQRVSEYDPCDDLIKSRLPDGRWEYDLVALPTEYDPDLYRALGRDDNTTSIGWKDWRTTPGELLFPDLFPADVIAQAKIDLTPLGYAAQHGQRPVPARGGFFDRSWWRFWVPNGVAMPKNVTVDTPKGTIELPTIRLPEISSKILSADFTFKDTVNSDFVAIQAWGFSRVENYRAARFLMDQAHGRMDFPKTLATFEAFCEKHADAGAKLVEDAANGPAVMATLRGKIPGIIAITAKDGKEGRANAIAHLIESGCVYLPHPALPGNHWVHAFIAECHSFPKGAHDDQVDAMTQALARKRVIVV